MERLVSATELPVKLSANAVGVCDAAVEMATKETSMHWPGTQYFKDNQTYE